MSLIESPVLAAAPSQLTRNEAVRFLHRASFGGSVADVERLLSEGVSAWLDREFDEQPESRLYNLLVRDDRWAPSIWKRYLTGGALLRKRVAYAYSQIFVASYLGADGYAVAEYADLMERNAFGTYRELLETITKSVAMGQYLTYTYNIKADPETGQQPDENYAREILQLFSIGLVELDQDGTVRTDGAGNTIDTYGQDDVIGLARVFTGWYPNTAFERPERMRRPMVANPRWHEPGEKTFLGVTIPAGTSAEASLEIALDTIAAHPNVGPFIGRQLIQRLVTSNPSSGYVQRIADVFADDGDGVRGNMRAVIEAVLVDDEAWAPPTDRSGKLREPVLRFTIIARALGIFSTESPWRLGSLEDPATELGQTPWESPSVFNFYRPGYVPPQSALGNAGLVAPEFQIATESSTLGWVNFLTRMLLSPNSGIGYDLATLRPLTDDPPALVAELDSRITGGRLDADTIAIVETAVAGTEINDADRQQRERIFTAVVLIAASTDFLHER